VVNASLNWASIVGIVLAVGGAFLYFMRNFKPALARDYDVFFAAVGLLCGGILFFQGWRLDPILQFGQFLLAGTTVFFAYESVRLRGVTTEQARRSSYFDDEEPSAFGPRDGADYDNSYDRFAEPEPVRRRIRSRDEADDDLYRPRRVSRAAIPERAASRSSAPPDDWDGPRREPQQRPDRPERSERSERSEPSRYGSAASRPAPDFGARRRAREDGPEPRRGSRPAAASDGMPRSSRRPGVGPVAGDTGPAAPGPGPAGVPQGTPFRSSERSASNSRNVSDADFTPMDSAAAPRPRPTATPGGAPGPTPRDNSGRFDD